MRHQPIDEYLKEKFNEAGVLTERNAEYIEDIVASQETIEEARNFQNEVLESIYLSAQKKFGKDPERKARLLPIFTEILAKFPKIYTTITRY